MSAMFWDRISGRLVDQIPGRALLGRWYLHGDQPDVTGLRLNRLPVAAGEPVVPDASAHFTLARPGQPPIRTGRFAPSAELPELETDTIRKLGRLLASEEKVDAGWAGWTRTSPLAPGLRKAVSVPPLLPRIEKRLWHLEQVCRKPFTHIRIETERLNLWRARRISRRAPEYLAAHTEDWEKLKLDGIYPRRILALVREEQWDLYENRVAAQLVDYLVLWLQDKVFQVQEVLDKVYRHLSGQTSAGTWQRSYRIHDLWGEAVKADEEEALAQRTLRSLSRALYRVLALQGTKLYKRVRNRAGVSPVLHVTNLLANDPHYRGVARLWNDFHKLGRPRRLSADELQRQHQELLCGWDAWCMLAIVHACRQLRLEAPPDQQHRPIRPGVSLSLEPDHELRWEPTGEIVLLRGVELVARFVPLVHPLEQAQDQEQLDRLHNRLQRAAELRPGWTLILHPEVISKKMATTPAARAHLAGAGHLPLEYTSGTVDFLRISPFSLSSIERLARVLRWVTQVPRMLAYPPTISAPPQFPGLKTESARAWLECKGGQTTVLRPPAAAERKALGLDAALAQASKELAETQQEMDELAEELVRSKDNRRYRAELNRKKRPLSLDLAERERTHAGLETFHRQLEEANAQLTAIATCPVCGEPGDLQPRQQGCFSTTCLACEATWELRHDPDQEERIPVLMPQGADRLPIPREAHPSWVDDVYGSDVLAIPVSLPDGKVVYRLPD